MISYQKVEWTIHVINVSWLGMVPICEGMMRANHMILPTEAVESTRTWNLFVSWFAYKGATLSGLNCPLLVVIITFYHKHFSVSPPVNKRLAQFKHRLSILMVLKHPSFILSLKLRVLINIITAGILWSVLCDIETVKQWKMICS